MAGEAGISDAEAVIREARNPIVEIIGAPDHGSIFNTR